MLITLARKPLCGSVVQNVLTHGCGALNIDETRISHVEPIVVKRASLPEVLANQPFKQAGRWWDKPDLRADGRWPANVILSGDEVLAGFPDVHPATSRSGAGWRTQYVGGDVRQEVLTSVYPDSGSAARFFRQVGE